MNIYYGIIVRIGGIGPDMINRESMMVGIDMSMNIQMNSKQRLNFPRVVEIINVPLIFLKLWKYKPLAKDK